VIAAAGKTLGAIVRDFVYLYFGYTSLSAANEIIHGLEGAGSIVTIVMAVIGLGVVGWIVYRRKFKSQSKV
jgi:membrane protein DedA with SNARE-associated domain